MDGAPTLKDGSVQIYHRPGQRTGDSSYAICVRVIVWQNDDSEFGMTVHTMSGKPGYDNAIELQTEDAEYTLPLGTKPEVAQRLEAYQTRWDSLCSPKKPEEALELTNGVLPDDSELHSMVAEAFNLGWSDTTPTDRAVLQSREIDNTIKAEPLRRLSTHVGRALLSRVKIELTDAAYGRHCDHVPDQDEELILLQYDLSAGSSGEHDDALSSGDTRVGVKFEDPQYTSQLRTDLVARQAEEEGESPSSDSGIMLVEALNPCSPA